MVFTDETLHLAVRIGSLGLVLALVGISVLYVAYDRQRARFIALQGVFALYLRKALEDRNDKVRIPADQVQEMFELTEIRTIQKFKPPFRIHRHPATLTPSRRRHLG